MTIQLPISDYDTVARALYEGLRQSGRENQAAEAACLIFRWSEDLERGVQAVLSLIPDLRLEWAGLPE